MELSPLARERLAKIGDLSPEEKGKIKQSGEMDSLLSEYFKGALSPEGLWKKLKVLKEQSGESIVGGAQGKLIDTLRSQMSQADFEQRRSAILAIETIKAEGKYSLLEAILNSIVALRQKYTQTREQAYKQLKAGMEKQLQAAAQEALKQGMQIDMESSVEANIKNSPQWKGFITEHEKTFEEMFNGYIAQLRELI